MGKIYWVITDSGGNILESISLFEQWRASLHAKIFISSLLRKEGDSISYTNIINGVGTTIYYQSKLGKGFFLKEFKHVESDESERGNDSPDEFA